MSESAPLRYEQVARAAQWLYKRRLMKAYMTKTLNDEELITFKLKDWNEAFEDVIIK